KQQSQCPLALLFAQTICRQKHARQQAEAEGITCEIGKEWVAKAAAATGEPEKSQRKEADDDGENRRPGTDAKSALAAGGSAQFALDYREESHTSCTGWSCTATAVPFPD